MDISKINLNEPDNCTPMVTIVVVTYNQEQFIEQTLLSLVNQKTRFKYEILVGDDFSSDGTRIILTNFEKKFQGLIRVNFNKENLGIVGNWISTIRQAKSKYIAFCEGDDFWIDDFKLQKQVDFLESNTNYGMVCTDYNKYFEKNKSIKENCFNVKKYLKEVRFKDYVYDRGSIATATVLLKKELFDQYEKEIPENLRIEWKMPDSPFWLFILNKTRVGVLPDSTACYRIREVSGCRMSDELSQFWFVFNGYEIPLYIVKHFSLDNSIKRKLLLVRVNYAMEFAFKQDSIELFNEVLDYDLPINKYLIPRFWLFRFGFMNNINRSITNRILKKARR